MSLFNAPKGAVLVHACNAQGVWGSGIAKEFKERFPSSFKQYHKYCKDVFNVSGTSYLTTQENTQFVGCLITSDNYGKNVDSKDKILVNTICALRDLAERYPDSMFYSNKFNSGLFGVPWEETERFLKVIVEKYNLDWTVCVQD